MKKRKVPGLAVPNLAPRLIFSRALPTSRPWQSEPGHQIDCRAPKECCGPPEHHQETIPRGAIPRKSKNFTWKRRARNCFRHGPRHPGRPCGAAGKCPDCWLESGRRPLEDRPFPPIHLHSPKIGQEIGQRLDPSPKVVTGHRMFFNMMSSSGEEEETGAFLADYSEPKEKF